MNIDIKKTSAILFAIIAVVSIDGAALASAYQAGKAVASSENQCPAQLSLLTLPVGVGQPATVVTM
jgi:hypothetical protein